MKHCVIKSLLIAILSCYVSFQNLFVLIYIFTYRKPGDKDEISCTGNHISPRGGSVLHKHVDRHLAGLAFVAQVFGNHVALHRRSARRIDDQGHRLQVLHAERLVDALLDHPERVVHARADLPADGQYSYGGGHVAATW